jgi:6-phosphogluconolactonase/glucosamine-6-phosphate isomerase/deaminase
MVKDNLISQITGNKFPKLINYYHEDIYNNIMKIDSQIPKNSSPDVAILGFGNDGHTASLFPGHPEIFQNNNTRLIIIKNISEQFHRISLTFEFLMKSKQIIFLISGNDKRRALKDALYGKYQPMLYPAQYIFRKYKKQITIFCDRSVYPDSLN